MDLKEKVTEVVTYNSMETRLYVYMSVYGYLQVKQYMIQKAKEDF